MACNLSLEDVFYNAVVSKCDNALCSRCGKDAKHHKPIQSFEINHSFSCALSHVLKRQKQTTVFTYRKNTMFNSAEECVVIKHRCLSCGNFKQDGFAQK